MCKARMVPGTVPTDVDTETSAPSQSPSPRTH
jgi:hypothetical protein